MNTDRTKYVISQIVKGKTYFYFRYKGKRIPLPADRNSAEFRRAYDAALRSVKLDQAEGVVAAPARGSAPDSLEAAIEIYLDSAAFDKLAPSTKAGRMYTLKQLRTNLGTGKLADLDTDALEIYMDRLAKRNGTSVADLHKKVLSKIWKVCRKFSQFNLKGKPNPTTEAEPLYTVGQRHRPWPRHVQETFMAKAKPHMKLAKLLLHFSVQRGCDAVRMRWDDYDGKGISVRQQKLHGERDTLADYYILPDVLRQALDAAPREAETILVNGRGTPYANANILSAAFRRELTRLGLIKPGERSHVMHGLRKTGATDLGQLGVGTEGLKSVGGWRSDAEAQYYAADADKRVHNANAIEAWNAAHAREARERKAKARRAQLKAVS